MEPLRRRLLPSLLLTGLITVTILLIEPAKSAVINWEQIDIGFGELLARLAGPLVLALLGASVVSVLLAWLAPRRSLSLWVALAVGLWAQGNLFVWDYGIFDGAAIDWDRLFGAGLLEAAAWASLLGVALVKPDPIRRHALGIGAALLALQGIALASVLYDNTPLPERLGEATAYPIDEVAQFSRDSNVIIIVVDSLQSDLFAEAMWKPKLRAALPPGFTYYRNAVSLYPTTEFSLQSILTSRAVPDDVRILPWKREQMKESLPARLTGRGFDSVMTGPSTYLDCSFARDGYACLRNAALSEVDAVGASWREDVSALVLASLFRLAPHFLKPSLYDGGAWKIPRLYPAREREELDERIHPHTRSDLLIFDHLIRSASALDGPPRFRLFHFYGAHHPVTANESCEFQTRRESARQVAVAASRCILSRLYAFLDRLDQIGVYDRSLIFVVADHGHLLVDVDPSVASPPIPSEAAPSQRLGDATPHLERPGRGLPVFLVKAIGDRKPLSISDRPVSLCDVPRSVAEALEMEHAFGCESLFRAETPRAAPRMHYRYPTRAERARARPEMRGRLQFEKFAIRGHAWLADSWVRVSKDAE